MSALQWVGAAFVLLLVGFLFYAYSRPQRPGDGKTDIIRFICAMCAGFAGGLFVGDALFKLDTSVGMATKMAVTGSAGFAFAFVVWYGYGRTRLPTGYSISVPDGWTFQQAAQAMVGQEGAVVDFQGFEAAELAAQLRPAQITKRTLEEALGTLGSLSRSTIRRYHVAHNSPKYVLTVHT